MQPTGAKKQTNNVIKIMKQNNACQTRVPQKLKEMKNILRQITLKKFIASQKVPRDLIGEFLGWEENRHQWEHRGAKGKRELEREYI